MSSVRQPQVISLKNNIAVQELSSSTDKRPLFIKQGECYHKVSADAILYIESDNVYINVYTAERKYFVRSTIDQYLDLIQQNNFMRYIEAML
ncbi:MAG: LytTR family transcriptional regulator [Bacteroidetes bacterium]|nr:LytTR family transcriptional regulator [Bacteroidota bacterium]